jgi:hypothetical protein
MNYDYSMLPKAQNTVEKKLSKIYVPASGTLALLAIFASAQQRDNGISDATFGLVVIVFIALPLISLFVGLWRDIRDEKALNKFSAINNVRMLESRHGLAEVPSSLNGLGDSVSVNYGYKIPVPGNANDYIDVFEYEQTQGSGKNKHITYFTIAAFEAAEELPHIFLDAKENGLTHRYSESQKVALEGDLNNYFDLFLPDMANIEARQLLTPPVMQTLVESGANYDIEINGKSIAVFAPGELLRRDTLPALLAFSEALRSELANENVHWAVVKEVVGTVVEGATATELRRGSYRARSIAAAILAGAAGFVIVIAVGGQ